jgi:hypothetical protein
MSSPTYSAADIVDKTLTAAKKIAVYDFPDSTYQPIGYINPGQPVGLVYSWIGGGVTAGGTADLWWMLWPSSSGGDYYYVKQEEGAFDLAALAAQGVRSLEQKQAEANLQALPWYERLIKQYGIVVLIGLVAAGAAKGYFSRPTKTSN